MWTAFLSSSLSLGYENRIALYADDVILFLKNLSECLPALMDLIKRFDNISGYKINSSKSSILLLNPAERDYQPNYVGQFKTVSCFTYLGIQITHRLEEVVQANYNPVITSIHDSIDKWISLPISQIGRINVLKMNSLPKLLYLFQNIPLPPPPDVFSRLKKLFNNFIWRNRRPRLSLSLT